MKRLSLGLIPVRGGSKRILRKNLYPVAGHPLLWHSIQTARLSKLDLLYVCTEDEEMATYAESQGCLVLRHDPSLSQDASPVLPVLQRAVESVQSSLAENVCIEAVSILRATSPCRLPSDIDTALELLATTRDGVPADSVVGVTEHTGMHPSRLKVIVDECDGSPGFLSDAFSSFPEGPQPQSSSSLRAYLRNSAIYVVRPQVLLDGSLWGANAVAYVMPPERSIDINDAFDLRVAELVLQQQLHMKGTELPPLPPSASSSSSTSSSSSSSSASSSSSSSSSSSRVEAATSSNHKDNSPDTTLAAEVSQEFREVLDVEPGFDPIRSRL